jgi:putative hemolysin
MLVVLFAVITYGAHAVTKHGTDADAVRECMENDGPMQVWVKPDGRVMNICKLPDGRFGVMVTDGTREITSFIYRAGKGCKTILAQVENYLRNMGAQRIYYP